jgi:nucleotide-binding universal stress UspA family protein
MNTILVPLDGSREAEAVLPFIPTLARTLAARVELLRVVPDQFSEVPVLHDLAASYGVGEETVVEQPALPSLDTRRRHAEGDHLGTLIDLRAHGLDVELVVETGHPAEVILARATTTQATLIAMATHGYSGLRRWALGSVTDKVVHAATTPVFVVRSTAERMHKPVIQRILLPIDASAFSRKALPIAVRLAVASAAQLLLVHVLEPPAVFANADPYLAVDLAASYADPANETRQRADDALRMLAEQLQTEHQLEVRYEIRTGLAAHQIIAAAAHHKSDLVVMATHGYSGLQRWALGSVADKVLHACPQPLILVHAGEVGPTP